MTWLFATLIYFLVLGGVIGAAWFTLFTVGLTTGLFIFGRNSEPAAFGTIAMLIGGVCIAVILFIIVNNYLMNGMYRMAIRQTRGETISVVDLFGTPEGSVSVTIANSLMGLLIFIAAITVVGPFLLLGLFAIVVPLIVDRGASPVEAMQRSWGAVKGDLLVASLLHLASALIAGVLPIVTMPIYFLVPALLYREYTQNAAVHPSSVGLSSSI